MVLLSAEREKSSRPLCLGQGDPPFVAHQPCAAALARIHPCAWGLAPVEREDDGKDVIWVNRRERCQPEAPLSSPAPGISSDKAISLASNASIFFFLKRLKDKRNSILIISYSSSNIKPSTDCLPSAWHLHPFAATLPPLKKIQNKLNKL